MAKKFPLIALGVIASGAALLMFRGNANAAPAPLPGPSPLPPNPQPSPRPSAPAPSPSQPARPAVPRPLPPNSQFDEEAKTDADARAIQDALHGAFKGIF